MILCLFLYSVTKSKYSQGMAEQEGEGKKILVDKNNNIQYIRGKLLGTGGFAKCFEAINQENQKIYAVKVIPKKSISEKRQRYKLLVQIKIHRSLKHRHIVEFIQTFQDRQNVYILLEYCRNYTLKDLVKRRKRISEYETRIYIYQVVKALLYIHSQSIIHRDLKLGNILINDQMDTKICDFGLSTRVKHEGEIKRTICGTPNYIAPEILQQNGHSYQVDIWSIGVIMYTLLFGKPPFEDHTVEQTYQNIKTNRFNYPAGVPASSQAKNLINKILVTDPSKRISLEGILEHQFMQLKADVPREIPAYTLAVPPFKFIEIESKHLGVCSHNMSLSEELENLRIDRGDDSYSQSEARAEVRERQLQRAEQNDEKIIKEVYIKQCFEYKDMLGYLLSNGIIGTYFKDSDTNLVFEFGSGYYNHIGSKNELPIRRALPQNDFQLGQDKLDTNLQSLLNFRSYFITRYGVFKLDQLRKQYLNLQSTANEQSLDRPIFLRKYMRLPNGELLTRLSNQMIQLHFNDLTNLTIHREDNKGLYFMGKGGKIRQVDYNQERNEKLKTKIRMFSNLLEKLSLPATA